jgi:hypothetical protein
LVWIATLIVLMVWMNRAHKATSTLEPANRRWTSGWTVGGWFIPFANFVIPKLVLNEIERIATAPRENGRVTASWRYQALSAGGWAWWLLLVAANVISLVSGTFGGGAELTESELRSTYNWGAMSEAAFAVSAVFGVFVVRRISAVLVPEALPQAPGWGGAVPAATDWATPAPHAPVVGDTAPATPAPATPAPGWAPADDAAPGWAAPGQQSPPPSQQAPPSPPSPPGPPSPLSPPFRPPPAP